MAVRVFREPPQYEMDVGEIKITNQERLKLFAYGIQRAAAI